MLSFSSSGSSSASFKHQLSRPSSKSDEVSFALPCLSCSISTGDSSCHVKLSQSHKTRMWMCNILATSLHHPYTQCTHSVHTFRTANFSRGSIMIHEPSLPRPHPSTVTGNGRAWHCLHRRLHSRLPGLRQLRQPHQPGNTATAGRPLVDHWWLLSWLALETLSKNAKNISMNQRHQEWISY